MTAGLGLRSTTVRANGLDFGLLEAGSGPLALCLHGFPDTAHTWRHLLPVLAGAGFHAVAPFMRGYAPTAVPADGAYQLGALIADSVALHEILGGGGDAVLIGHDWGAETAYGAGSGAVQRLRAAQAVLLHLPVPRPARVRRGAGGQRSDVVPRPALAGLVARLRRRRGSGPGQGEPAAAGQPGRRHRLLPGGGGGGRFRRVARGRW